MPRISLRPATAADVEAVTDIHTAARTAYYLAGGRSDEELTSPTARAERRAAWRRAIEREDRTVLCAVDAGADEVVGVLSMGLPHDDDIDPATTGQLHQIHVRPDSWGKGIGALLHEGFVGLLRERALTTGVLEAWGRNARARSFYAHHGWRPDGHTRPGPGEADYIRLRLELNRASKVTG